MLKSGGLQLAAVISLTLENCHMATEGSKRAACCGVLAVFLVLSHGVGKAVGAPGLKPAPERNRTNSFLPIPSTDVCGWLEGKKEQCPIIGTLEYVLTLPQLLHCDDAPNGPQVLPVGTPQQLQDLRPLPPTLSLDQLTAKEGSTYYWLFRTVLNVAQYTPCSINNTDAQLLLPQNWTLVRLLDLPQGNSKPSTLPFAAILLNPDTSQLVVAIRGTQSAYEWSLDFSYNQTLKYFEIFGKNPIEVGFGKAFAALWIGPKGVRAALDQYVVTQKALQVFVTGHSLGAATATLVAYATQSHLNKKMAKAPVVSTVLFAPPNVAGSNFTNSFNKLVNARRLAFADDVVPQIPCAPSITSCPALKNGFPIPTQKGAKTVNWPYSQVGGSLEFAGVNMPRKVSSSWSKLTKVSVPHAPQFLQATHICSYLCFTSQYATGGPDAVPMNYCQLKKALIGKPSYCKGFPKRFYP